MCPRTLSDRYDQTETDRVLWFFSTGPDKIKFTDWFQVNQMLGCGEIAIFRPRMMIWKSVVSNFVGTLQLNRGR